MRKGKREREILSERKRERKREKEKKREKEERERVFERVTHYLSHTTYVKYLLQNTDGERASVTTHMSNIHSHMSKETYTYEKRPQYVKGQSAQEKESLYVQPELSGVA